MIKQILILMVLPLPLFAAEVAEWELKRDRDGIQVYTGEVAGSPYDAVRSEALIEGVTLSSLVALVNDAEACADWADRCAESYVVEQLSDTEAYVYTHNDMPFPVRDRDVVVRMQWSQDPQSLAVRMNSTAVSGQVDEIRSRLRLSNATASWLFEPLADGSIKVVNEAHLDPGSALPGWLTNMLLVDTPFETMKAFLAEVRKPKYQDSIVSFVTEP